MNICRDCEGFEEDRMLFKSSHWFYNEKVGCPLWELRLKNDFNTLDEAFKVFKEKCANEKVIALNEPGVT